MTNYDLWNISETRKINLKKKKIRVTYFNGKAINLVLQPLLLSNMIMNE